ncbi:hypothetical protein BU23DRAFT_576040 [Bimuria novae-zelandiae CBS 107.79]|uniref:Uncharacterized protein n=1 Tax=Bimuria novae-zelandiae CBS 107.79 TaxID=1447943 RepID=A0A6A5UFM1_9PLEO|nr:hypothetical protein BU23DRAFT_576040 [Bimuria novae-zelandiae CBS 107.79]
MPHMKVWHGQPPVTSCHASKTPNCLVHSGGVHAAAAIVTPCQWGHVVLIHRGTPLRDQTARKQDQGFQSETMLSPENGVRGSRDVLPGGNGFQSALLDRNTEGGSMPLSQCFHSKPGGHYERRKYTPASSMPSGKASRMSQTPGRPARPIASAPVPLWVGNGLRMRLRFH